MRLQRARPCHDCETCETRPDGIFATLGGDDLARLNRATVAHAYKRGQVLFHEGHPPGDAFCLRSGIAKVYKTVPGDRRHILSLAEPGDVLGLEGLVTGGPRPATAEMLQDGIVCRIDRAELLRILRERPDVCRLVTKALAHQLLRSEEERAELASAAVRERLALTLLALAARFGETADGSLRIGADLSREDLADMIGSSTETAIRQLGELRDRGILATGGRAIRLLDPERLSRIARLRPGSIS